MSSRMEGRIIIHVDMDAFYASVEIRDDPSLKGKPVVIGAMPDERGVVSTCSYEAREFGIRSGMNIKEAYRLCPDAVFMHPNFDKYKQTSEELHSIWDPYASASEPIAFDETFLDITERAGDFDRGAEIAHELKRRTLEETGLTCSVGLAYCKAAAKTASEERKPDGYFEIRTREEFVSLMSDRDVRELFSVGPRTAERLRGLGIDRISDIPEHSKEIREAMGKHGDFLIGLAQGIDDREVTPYRPENAKSVSREMTFQADITDYGFLHDVLLLMALSVEERASKYGLKGNGVQIKVTYTDMKTVTRVRSNNGGSDALSLAKGAWTLLDDLEKKPVRLIGIGMTDIGNKKLRQTTLDEKEEDPLPPGEELSYFLERMHRRYRFDFVKNREWMLRIDRLHGVVEHMRIQKIKAAKKHRTDQSVPRHSWKRTNQDSVHGKVQE